MGGNGRRGQLLDELGRYCEFTFRLFVLAFPIVFMEVVPVHVVGVEADLVGVAGFEMGIMIAIACICTHCIRLVLRTERPLDPEAEAADAAEELDHAEASPVITTAIVMDTDTIGRHLYVVWLVV